MRVNVHETFAETSAQHAKELVVYSLKSILSTVLSHQYSTPLGYLMETPSTQN